MKMDTNNEGEPRPVGKDNVEAPRPSTHPQMDQAQLDLFAIDPETEEQPGRPWLAVIDTYTRTVMGFVTFPWERPHSLHELAKPLLDDCSEKGDPQ